MLKILIVEDDSRKLQQVLATVLSCEGVTRGGVATARDVASAKRALRDVAFDLMVLDVMLPETEDLTPSRDAGLRLLREIVDRSAVYNVPAHIVGLSGVDEVFDEAAATLATDLWYLLRYDASSDSWRSGLARRIRHIVLAQKSSVPLPDFLTDLCVVTALYEPELAAVLALPWEWVRTASLDSTEYYQGSFSAAKATKTVVCAAAHRMGMAASAALTAKMIERFRPRYVAMVGIAAGLKGRANAGDILAAEFAWDWGSGKLHRSDGTPGFSPAPFQIGPDALVLGRLSMLARDYLSLESIRAKWPTRPDTALRVHIGPFASGAAVVADAGITAAIAKYDRKVIGLEMEAFGMFTASREASLPVPSAFCMKSVCDFADDAKDDKFQPYAAYTSAEALRVFSERYLFMDT